LSALLFIKFYARSPVTNHLSVSILMAVATEFATRSFGDVDVAPVDKIVVVPGVTAVIVG
jgi:hypothetical protein